MTRTIGTDNASSPSGSVANAPWKCPLCGRHTTWSTDLRVICESRLCGCGALGLMAPSYDSDEIIDDAINIFGIADGYLTEYDSDRIAGLRRIDVEVADGPAPQRSNGHELRVLWFRRATQGNDGLLAFGRILSLLDDLPGPRTTPGPDDIAGNFDVWFDGGAVKHVTGTSRYLFADGSTASVTTSLVGNVSIRLATGQAIRLSRASIREQVPSRNVAQTGGPDVDVKGLRNAFGPFAIVFEPREPHGPTHRSLLHLDENAELPLTQIRDATRVPEAPRFIQTLFRDSHWWPGFVAGVAYLWDSEGRFDRRWLWTAIDSGNWATPQLVVIAFFTDKHFAHRVRRRVETGCMIRMPEVISVDPWIVEELGSKPEPSSKLLGSILGIAPASPALRPLEPRWRTDPRFVELIQEDAKYDRADLITSRWLASVTQAFASLGVALTPAESRRRTLMDSVQWLIDDWMWTRRLRRDQEK